MRRTVSIDDTLYNLIQKFRGNLLSNVEPLDLSFTESLNFFLARGLANFYGIEDETKFSMEILRGNLSTDGLIDEFQDKWIKNELPKFLQQFYNPRDTEK